LGLRLGGIAHHIKEKMRRKSKATSSHPVA
jgi:hypothetical protein